VYQNDLIQLLVFLV